MKRFLGENLNRAKLMRIAALLLADIVLINLSAFAALLLRFELSPALAAESGFLDSVSSYMLLRFDRVYLCGFPAV